MTFAWEVVGFFVVVGAWLGLLGWSIAKRRYRAFLIAGVLLTVAMNARYFVAGAGDSIAFFVGIYDVLHNVGVSDNQQVAALTACVPGDDCSIWGSTYAQHPSWGVAFYRRFVDGNVGRLYRLYGHILFNTLAFVLMTFQLFNPGTAGKPRRHRWVGWASLAALALGVGSATLLASEHGPVSQYGGALSMYGFWFMGACVVGTALMGVVTARKGDYAAHGAWMFRYAGSMWGSFWFFRVLELVLGPILRNVETASILVCIWGSAPLGILVAEIILRRRQPSAAQETSPAGSVEAA